jgi:hypothetical protein
MASSSSTSEPKTSKVHLPLTTDKWPLLRPFVFLPSISPTHPASAHTKTRHMALKSPLQWEIQRPILPVTTMNRGRLRKWQWMSALWLLLLAGPLPAANTEADVKAAFIYNFTKFVEWPPTALADNTPLQLCVLGQDDTSSRLRQLHGREAQGRRSLQVRQLTAPKRGRRLSCPLHYSPCLPSVKGGSHTTFRQHPSSHRQ